MKIGPQKSVGKFTMKLSLINTKTAQRTAKNMKKLSKNGRKIGMLPNKMTMKPKRSLDSGPH
jgi:hypothetical protein